MYTRGTSASVSPADAKLLPVRSRIASLALERTVSRPTSRPRGLTLTAAVYRPSTVAQQSLNDFLSIVVGAFTKMVKVDSTS